MDKYKIYLGNRICLLLKVYNQYFCLQERIREIQANVQCQQNIIKQTSAALNCCYDADHGKGSVTELEAQKLLLIASKPLCCLLPLKKGNHYGAFNMKFNTQSRI